MIADLLQRLKRIAGRSGGPGDDIDALIERIGARHTPEDRRRAYALFLQNALYAPVVSMGAEAGPGGHPGESAKSQATSKKKSKAAKKKKSKQAAKKSSKKKRTDQAGDQRMSLAMAGVNGFQMLLMYTSGDDDRIARDAEHKLALPGRRAFQMTLETEGVDGLLIHNKRNSWMALPNELLREILDVFPEEG